MGSIEPGKQADLLVTDGSPLQSLTRIERMWVGGLDVGVTGEQAYPPVGSVPGPVMLL